MEGEEEGKQSEVKAAAGSMVYKRKEACVVPYLAFRTTAFV